MANFSEPAPSTSAKVLQFLEETQISEDMAQPSSQPRGSRVSAPNLEFTDASSQNGQNGQDTQNHSQNSQHIQNSQNIQNIQYTQNSQNSQNSQNNNQNIDSEYNSNSQNTQNFHISNGADAGPGVTDINNNNNNNKYKNMLRYKLNSGFKDEVSSVNGISVPNTFKHKSHPNARTKTQIGTSFHETSSENALDAVLADVSETAIKTSTLRVKNRSLDDEHTPNWMPSVLETRWDEASPEEHVVGSKNKEMPLNFLNSNSNTFVHNANAAENGAHTTPIWKKVADGYQSKIDSEPPLQKVFQSYFDQSKDSNKPDSKYFDQSKDLSRPELKSAVSGFSSLSTVSTPIATKDSENHLTESQIVQLENMLEQVKDQPDDYPVIGSPLKLFGNAYDTFTKSVLNQFVEKVRSNANSVQRHPKQPSSLPKFELRISDFTKSKDYTDKDFMKNADHIFAHIQKKRPTGDHLFDKKSPDSFHQPSLSFIQNQNTATSTPKPNKVRSYTSSSSAQLTMDSELEMDSVPLQNRHYAYEYSVDDYTAEEKTSLGHVPPRNASNAGEYNSYTFDKFSDLNSEYTSESSEDDSGKVQSDLSKETADTEAVPFLGSSISSVRKYPRNVGLKSYPRENVEKNYSKDNVEEREDLAEKANFIKWKRPSQLRLSSANNIRRSSVVKGVVKPGEYPDQYGNMVLDPKEQKWVSNDKENTLRGSLDSIEDLVSSLDVQGREGEQDNFGRDSSILKRPSNKKRSDQNLEVSFQLPESSFGTSNRSQHFDVTAVSALTNNTFSQSNKDIVSLITGSTDESVWERIHSITLSGKNISHLESLDSYLPSLQSVDVSQNQLAFVEGLPACVSELDVSENFLDSRASFRKLRDLQILNASFNRLETLSGLNASHNLTQLNLSGNQIRGIEELRPLRSLISLNISRNKIHGKLDFARYNFANLQELNMAENMVTCVQGLEHIPNLRILNVNENKLSKLMCQKRHGKLKKLCVKFNYLRSIDVQDFPYLRILRIDGNRFKAVNGLKKLKFLQEFSARCQVSSEVVEAILQSACDVISMDLSGVSSMESVFRKHCSLSFFNLNVLNLSAVGLTTLPSQFGDMFPNVRELNLNFNKFESLSGLASLCRLRKLFLLSNNMSSMEDLVTSLQKSRKSLVVLDLRLNALNFRFYPYVFSPDELDHRVDAKAHITESPIPIHAIDDIENFSIHYKTVSRSTAEWRDRDQAFFRGLVQDGKKKHVQDRISYESLLLEFFTNLRELDGTRVSEDDRVQGVPPQDMQERESERSERSKQSERNQRNERNQWRVRNASGNSGNVRAYQN